MRALFLYFIKLCPAIFMAGFKVKSIKKRTTRELIECAFLHFIKLYPAIFMAGLR